MTEQLHEQTSTMAETFLALSRHGLLDSQLEKLRKTDDGTYRDALADIPDITTHAFVVCGVWRCGKSTLLQQFVKKLNKPFFI